MKRLFCLTAAGLLTFSPLFGQETPQEVKSRYDDPRLNTPVPFTLGDRDRLHTVELGLAALDKRMTQGFDAVHRRIDDTNRRIDDTNRRIDDLQRGLETTNERMLWMFGILVALGGGAFAYQNRKFEIIIERLNTIEAKLEHLSAKTDEMEKRQDRLEADQRRLEQAFIRLEMGYAAIKEAHAPR